MQWQYYKIKLIQTGERGVLQSGVLDPNKGWDMHEVPVIGNDMANEDRDKLIAQVGLDGYELVSIQYERNPEERFLYGSYYFKRPIAD